MRGRDPFLQEGSQASRGRGSSIRLPLSCLVAVTVVASALDHHAWVDIPDAGALHLKSDNILNLLYDFVTVFSGLYHCVSRSNQAKVNRRLGVVLTKTVPGQ